MIDPFIRRAEHRDATVLGMLESTARAALAEVRGGRRWLDAHAEIGDGWPLAVDQRVVFVAAIQSAGDSDSADAVVGYLVADLVDDPMLVVRIDQVFVGDEARELGFGDALVEAAMEWGREAGAELIEAETLPGDRNLKNLYERAGVTARLITVSKRLSAGRQSLPAELEAPGLAAGTEIHTAGRPAKPDRPAGGGLRQEPLPPAPPASRRTPG